MMRLPLAFVALVSLAVLSACPSKKAATTTGAGSGAGSDSTPVLAKKISLSWGIQQAGSSAEIFLQTTDETGKQVSHPIGTFKGTCSATTPAADMKALLAVQCKDGATGTELHAIVQTPSVVVLKLRIDDGVTPDPMAREEVTRVPVPTGAAVVVP
jgi:hypothetical protein